AAVARPAEQPGPAPRQRHVGALAPERVAGQGGQGRGQAGLAAGPVQDQGIGQAVVLDDVADRPVQGEGRHRRLALDLDPGRQQLLHQPRPKRRARRAAGLALRGGRRGLLLVHAGQWAEAVPAPVLVSVPSASPSARPVSAWAWASSASAWAMSSAEYQPPSRWTMARWKSSSVPSSG